MSPETKNDGGPAFPTDLWTDEDTGMGHKERPGMSLRDYFAGHALAGILAQGPDDLSASEASPNPMHETMADMIAAEAYLYADALLAERRK